MKIEITDDSVDEIILNSLKEQRDFMSSDLKKLKRIKNPKPYVQEDIVYHTNYLQALKTVIAHYSPMGYY
jgi:hypothetical protein